MPCHRLAVPVRPLSFSRGLCSTHCLLCCVSLAGLQNIAATFDSSRHGARASLSGFSGRKLTPIEFQYVLGRSLGLNLSFEEIRGLMAAFDDNDDGYLECHEFIKGFFKLSFDARSDERSRRFALQFETQRKLESEAREAKRAAAVKEEEAFNTPFTEEDRVSALAKLGDVAKYWYSQKYLDRIKAQAFNALMTPTEFRKQLIRSFDLYLTQGQLSALCNEFDRNRDGKINGSEFVYLFFKLKKEQSEAEIDRVRFANQKRSKILQEESNTYPKCPKHLGR